ncbi:hypothetical protein G4B88_018175, partial [Cannabis sativa]
RNVIMDCARSGHKYSIAFWVCWGLEGVMAFRKYVPSSDAPPSITMKPLEFSSKMHDNPRFVDPETALAVEPDIDIDLREVYFLIMHFLSAGPCRRTCGQFWNELQEHKLLPRRYHAWYSRNDVLIGDGNDDGMSIPLSYRMLVERYSHIQKDHLVRLLKQLLLSAAPPRSISSANPPNAADVPTLVGVGSFSLLNGRYFQPIIKETPAHMRWPHMKADQVRGLSLREIGGGFTRHHRAPSIRAACYAIAKPTTMVQKMQNIKKIRGHRNAVYCAIFDRLGRYVITGADDRLVKIWSMETAYCLASCRGHEGDITDLAVSANNAVVASSSNDCIIRVWRIPDGLPVSVLRGHTGAVTAIAFSPRPGFTYQLLSSSDDGTCRIWEARSSQLSPRIYAPRPSDSVAGRNNVPSSSTGAQNHQIFCCAFNANGTVFVTGSSDTLARVWSACKQSSDDANQPNHEIDVLSGHENDVNYVQFSGCAVASRFMSADNMKEENVPKFKNSCFTNENIVTCSRDGSAIIWIPRSRRSHGKPSRWTRAYHLKVPPPPTPPQPPRGGPRQRILPTPRGVNMIIWSLDNRFVLAAIMEDLNVTYVTYVLDVHPFNPRIAMSAGYDGKTIVWDIWEGKPIRTYEISHHKLVDGKFSPDGTSIILSDDVGQLYILNTGQGESQDNAKYDQFFLGDYRPLSQDTHGNVVDQETQIAPYRRNLQDLLCDSGMIPYSEPYQSSYQKRRLGALGVEWNPNSLKLATGVDFTLDPEYQILPLADLDIFPEPLPEFVDVMDWEPDNEIQSDDADSDFNVALDYFSGGEQGSLSSNSSVDSEGSAENGETDDTQVNRRRKSKRRKQKAEIEITTSSGRRVKRRNFDESDGNPLRRNKTRKSKSGRNSSRKKSPNSKSSRPRRAAAKNALTLFSKITGTSTDGEDEDDSGLDTSESESILQDSNIESDGSDKYLQDEQMKHRKGKEISMDDSDSVKPPELHVNGGSRTKLVLKLPQRESNRPLVRNKIVFKCGNDGVGPSSRVPQGTIEMNGNCMNSQDPRYYPGNYAGRNMIEEPDRVQGNRVDLLNLSDDYKNGKIRWVGARARTSKRLRSGEAAPANAFSRTNSSLEFRCEKQNNFSQFAKPENDSLSELSDLQTQKQEIKGDEKLAMNGKAMGDDTCGMANGIEKLSSIECREYNNTSNFHEMVAKNATDSDNNNNNNMTELPHQDTHNASHDLPAEDDDAAFIENGNTDGFLTEETKIPSLLISTKLNLKRTANDSENPCEQEMKSSVDNLENGKYNLLNDRPLVTEQDLVVPEDKTANRLNLDRGDGGPLESDTQCDKNAVSSIKDSVESHQLPKKNMYTVVYRRTRSQKAINTSGGGGEGKGGSTSNARNHNPSRLDVCEESIDGSCGTQSTGLKGSASTNVTDNVKLTEGHESGYVLRNNQNSSMSKRRLSHEEWGSSSRTTVGLRSSRNRRGNHHLRETSLIDTTRKSNKSSGKGTWLMLTTHERGSRYIPQLGDEVAYLRQGHREYLEQHTQRREQPPWIQVKGKLRDVEYCKVRDLEYSSSGGSGESCCKMKLEFVDPTSDVYGRSFRMTLPEMTGFPDFLVERTRYDAAIQRNWTRRDKCQVWWKNDGDEDGGWWEARIHDVKAKSNDFPESPWERYIIKYKEEPTETHLHSPWELFDIDAEWEQPTISNDSKNHLQSAFAKLERVSKLPKDRYAINMLKELSQRPKFANRFPVPLSLEVIKTRLENNYYRSLEAVRHDFDIMLSNVENYLGSKSENSAKIKRLSDWFATTLSSL